MKESTKHLFYSIFCMGLQVILLYVIKRLDNNLVEVICLFLFLTFGELAILNLIWYDRIIQFVKPQNNYSKEKKQEKEVKQ